MTDPDWHRLPPLSTLRAFEATARLRGYSAAARALNVTPAAIAQQVRKLEAHVGATLVRRAGRGLALTEEGRQLGASLTEAFALIARGFDDLQLQKATRGVRVSTTDRFVDAVILPRLGEFWQRHPTLQVSFSPDGNTQPVDLDAFDVVVRGGAPGQTWGDAQVLELLETPMIICGTRDLVRSAAGDLSSVPWIRDSSIGGSVFETMAERAGCDPGTLRLVDPGGAKFELEAAMMGYGLHISPELTVRRQLAEGTLERVNVPLGMTGVYYAIYRAGLVAEPVRHFLDWLQAICAPLSSVDDPPVA
ncbi:LysR family transcriptional regulator [Seohaeicola saemankumensis]|nr:LysR substrate-binding domain-containing protein [Seohaeicola saemankumensis]MCA0871542.1 LysR family transcriptional regulator [Seohaeicola saemankumensis]